MRRRQFITSTAALGGLWALGPLAAACDGSKSAKAGEVRADIPRATPDAQATASAAALAKATAAFGWDLYGKLGETEKGNLFLSPHSIAVALGMLYAGTRGQSATQLARVLHVEALSSDLGPAFNAVDHALAQAPSLPKDAQPFELAVANSSWLQSGFPFDQAYLATLARYYGTGVHVVDFQRAPEAARVAVNDWVEEKTKDRIQDLLPPGSVNALTRLVLANAIYFKADWQAQFSKEATSPGPFGQPGTAPRQLPMMHQTASFPYTRGNGFQAIELPYAGNTVAMVVLLPEGAIGPMEASVALAAEDAVARLKPTRVKLTMPKWQFSSSFALSRALAALGAVDIFDATTADLSGIDGRRDLFVSDVFHKAFVAVDEKGTEAAAATGVVVGATSAPAEPPVNFTVDRPFVFFIRERSTGAVLFAGRVVDPST